MRRVRTGTVGAVLRVIVFSIRVSVFYPPYNSPEFFQNS